eukprot:CAMPEP_0206189538 /NCGR_PEP_ID=MMETSP0166-20121206/4225_1 /ASSEMBLY_ACC=CAM_ASM_000260 /TAXON_ID=95228 /ORGANISM="Vannella robusta, Strain DIVA3 518/3/11/1/6" /LENGTH=324 /DNA_ID=CAMNT_0053605467 /DNA_START=236 /DNA_END=1207 /DNA_ORIENTATION=+
MLQQCHSEEPPLRRASQQSAEDSEFSSFSGLIHEVRNISFSKDIGISLVKFPSSSNLRERKRSWTEHQKSNEVDISVIDLVNPPKRTKTNENTSLEYKTPLFFIPVALDVNETAQDFRFSVFLDCEDTISEETTKEVEFVSSEDEDMVEVLEEEDEQQITEMMQILDDPLFSTSETLSEDVKEGLDCIFGRKVEQALQFLVKYQMSDETLKKFASVAVKYDSLSYQHSLKMVQMLLYPKVQALTQPAPRILLATLLLVCDHHPKQVVEGLLLEVLKNDQEKQPINKFHAETMQRILSESLNKTSPDLLSHFMASFLAEGFPHTW